jgi:hypothetical protein
MEMDMESQRCPNYDAYGLVNQDYGKSPKRFLQEPGIMTWIGTQLILSLFCELLFALGRAGAWE